MFEFHGWICIEVDDQDDAECDVLEARRQVAIAKTELLIKTATDDFSLFDLKRTSNGLIVLITHGLRNHRYDPVIELFGEIAEQLPFSYGLLYVWDDEDDTIGARFENEFRVWRVARGAMTELSDPFLSPRIPVIEPEWIDPDEQSAD